MRRAARRGDVETDRSAARPVRPGPGRLLRALGTAGVAVLVVAVVLAPPASAVGTYSFTQQFTVRTDGTQQGLGFAKGLHHVGYDLGNGSGRISSYDDQGREVWRSKPIPSGHTNELSYSTRDDLMYVTRGGGTSPAVLGVTLGGKRTQVVRTVPFPSLTTGAVVAYDDTRNVLVAVTGPSGGPYRMVTEDLSGNVLRTVGVPDTGITQGIEVVGDQVLLLTSLSAPVRNQITVYSLLGATLQVIPVPVASESEGLSYDAAHGTVRFGTAVARVYRMDPAFSPPAG